MNSIVDKIAKDIMVKLKADSANRGSVYSPPKVSVAQPKPSTGSSALLLTANFRVIDKLIPQLPVLLKKYSSVIVSSYVYDNYGKDNICKGVRLLHSGNTPSHKVLEGISQITIPALSINSMAKAATLISDSFVTRVINHALTIGMPISVTDESIIDAIRYFPTGVANKISGFRRELEGMGVTFIRDETVRIIPDSKCVICEAGVCDMCNYPCPTTFDDQQPIMQQSLNTKFEDRPIKGNANSILEPSPGSVAVSDNPCADTCAAAYATCLSLCSEQVKQVISAGASRVDKGIDTKFDDAHLARYIDHTALKPGTTKEEIIKLCDEAKQYGFASVCVNPGNVALAAGLLKNTPVKVCTVVGFPLGATSTFVKAMETRDAIANGATEIDMVINVGALKSKDYELVKNDIARVVESANGNTVKVILETSLLNQEEKIKACELSKLAGADFVKTSTGFSSGGATIEDIKLMRSVVGPQMGVKASGGIRDTKTALDMIESGATRIGASASVEIVKGGKPTSEGY